MDEGRHRTEPVGAVTAATLFPLLLPWETYDQYVARASRCDQPAMREADWRAEMARRSLMASPAEIITRRIAAIVDRLCVAMEFTTVDTAVAAQTLHALTYAVHGPSDRTDDDFLPGIEADEAIELIRSLLPYVRAARERPGPEAPSA